MATNTSRAAAAYNASSGVIGISRLIVLAEAANKRAYLAVPEPKYLPLLMLAEAAALVLGENANNLPGNGVANNNDSDSAEEVIYVRTSPSTATLTSDAPPLANRRKSSTKDKVGIKTESAATATTKK